MLRNLFRRFPKPESRGEEQGVEAPKEGSVPVAQEEASASSWADQPQAEGFFQRLRAGLSKTRQALVGPLAGLLQRGRRVDETLFEELEEVLIRADVGVQTTLYLLDRLREEARRRGIRDAADLETVLKEEILNLLGREPEPIELSRARPFVLMVVGVNGVGKTTTIGKLAARYKGEGKRVLIAAGDTFRAAAIDQLEVWAQRAGAELIKQHEGADAAAVVYDAIQAAKARNADLLIVDTAGRLHTKKNLMRELEKIGRVAAREVAGAPHEVLLVLDATTGQNAVQQAREFREIVPVTGIALTKLDSSAKGGIVIAVRHELGIPVKLIGIGERIDDLRTFDPQAFVEALFARDSEAAA
ncbi:MAG: signal recognition particle-docking protein FtsY [Candidatus Poribacteria bacterium]|nr:MAG: signal recognition particle-docking protein FtsY [Candidatus Poribacteria bacterium]